MKRAVALALFPLVFLPSCRKAEDDPRPAPIAPQPPSPPAKAPELLYLPDGGDVALQGERPFPAEFGAASPGRCPAEMVDIAGRFCIDRYEASLVDARLGRAVSPYFGARRADVRFALEAFEGTRPRAAVALPRPPDWELTEAFSVKAVSRARVTPNGYLSGVLAREACLNAGKRLCSPTEWVTACRGERPRKFPYGDRYEPGACNVFREAHPASVLWGDASKNHLDPRLNLVETALGPLLRLTGDTPRCRSEWGSETVFDMVGNLDEWVDDPGGAFLGGFYARATENGCEARVSEHPPEYFDYSTGVRCCL
ncbi:MAG TPA: hypothetical protein VGK73_29090 [Polyangiaceae bacterium]